MQPVESSTQANNRQMLKTAFIALSGMAVASTPKMKRQPRHRMTHIEGVLLILGCTVEVVKPKV